MQEAICKVCGYEITNPVCIGCLNKGVSKFMENRPKLKEEVDHLISSLKESQESNERCITCKRKINVCDYCFHTYIYKILKKNNFEVSEKFSRIFHCGKNIVTPEFQFQY